MGNPGKGASTNLILTRQHRSDRPTRQFHDTNGCVGSKPDGLDGYRAHGVGDRNHRTALQRRQKHQSRQTASVSAQFRGFMTCHGLLGASQQVCEFFVKVLATCVHRTISISSRTYLAAFPPVAPRSPENAASQYIRCPHARDCSGRGRAAPDAAPSRWRRSSVAAGSSAPAR
jgi:hypothetical protein